MANQLVYTSSPKGLKPGAFGFCVVACTRGMKEQTASALEALSGYRRVYSDPQSALRNPVACSHVLFDTPTGRLRVLARVADAGLDYSGRTNKIASFFDVAANELVAPGPAALFSQPGLFVSRWSASDAPRYFETPTALPNVVAIPRGCDEWRRATGSSAWAGVLAATVATRQPVTLVARPDQNVLRLFQEAIALLSPAERWNATFSTYYMKAPPGVVCQWKAVMQGSPEEATLRSTPGALTINLTNPALLPNPESLATSPQARQLVAAAAGFASSGAFQRPASGKLPGATPSALPGAAPIGVPGVAGIPEQRGEGYALQPQEVAVPNGAPGRKKLNYGRAAVLKVNVPKTRKASSKSLISKLLIYVSVALLLLLSLAMVLWLKGPLKEMVKHSEEVKEASVPAGEQNETSSPDGESETGSSGNSPDTTEKDANTNASDNDVAKEGKEDKKQVQESMPEVPEDEPVELKTTQSPAADGEWEKDDSGSDETVDHTNRNASGGKNNGANASERSNRKRKDEGKIAEQIHSFIDKVLDEREKGKDASGEEGKLDELVEKNRKEAKNEELKTAISRYDSIKNALKLLEPCGEAGWKPSDFKELEGDEKEEGVFASGEYSKTLHNAFREFLKRGSQRIVRISLWKGKNASFHQIIRNGDFAGQELRFIGEGDVRFYVNPDSAGIWFKDQQTKLNYLLKYRLQIEAFEGDDVEELENEDFEGNVVSRDKVYVTKKQQLFRVDDSDSEGLLDLGWLDLKPFPQIRNMKREKNSIFFQCVTKTDHCQFKQSFSEDEIRDLLPLWHEKPKADNLVVLKCAKRITFLGSPSVEEYSIGFSLEKVASSQKIKGELLKVKTKEGADEQFYKKNNEGVFETYSNRRAIPCAEFVFNVVYRSDEEDVDDLVIGRLKIPFGNQGFGPSSDSSGR